MFQSRKLIAENEALKTQVEHLSLAISQLQERLKDPTTCVQAIMKRGIQWYDPSKLDQAGRRTYFNDSQAIVKSEVFTNELKHYMADLVHFAANQSKDFGAVMNIRASIVALETFKARLESIENPDRPEQERDPYAVL